MLVRLYDGRVGTPTIDPWQHSPYYATPRALDAGLDAVRQSPTDVGQVQMLVTRPSEDDRELHDTVTLDANQGVITDDWLTRGSSRMPNGAANPLAQVTVMNMRAARLFAGTLDRVPLAGDQIYVDLDLSVDNLPTGTLLSLGNAVLEVTAHPHTGCAKFSARFGVDALRVTATPEGRQLRLRGINSRVAVGGVVSVGDSITVLRPGCEGH